LTRRDRLRKRSQLTSNAIRHPRPTSIGTAGRLRSEQVADINRNARPTSSESATMRSLNRALVTASGNHRKPVLEYGAFLTHWSRCIRWRILRRLGTATRRQGAALDNRRQELLESPDQLRQQFIVLVCLQPLTSVEVFSSPVIVDTAPSGIVCAGACPTAALSPRSRPPEHGH
jgi:hypothetical protein